MAIKSEWNELTAFRADMAIPANNISAANVGGTEYTVVDADARSGVLDNRERIEELKAIVAGGVHYIGKTTTALSDGATTNPVTINEESVTAVQGDMVSMANPTTGKQDIEFIFNGTAWYELGSTGSLKAFAFADKGTVTVTPAGTLSVIAAPAQTAPVTATFAGTAATLSSAVTINSFTPAGAVNIGAYTPAGNITINNIDVGDKNITVKEVSSATFTGSEVSVAATFTGAEVSVAAAFTGSAVTLTSQVSAAEGTKTFNGTLKKLPALTATGSVNALTAVGSSSAAAGSASVTNGVLSFNFNNVLTSVNATTADVAVAVTPAYTNTLTTVADIAVSAAGTVISSVGGKSFTYTPTGTVSTTSFSPAGTVTTTKFTPSGTIDVGEKDVTKTVSIGTLKPTGSFSGTAATLTAEFEGEAATPTASDVVISYTPGGNITDGAATVSATTITGTFTGTSATYDVSPKTT